MLELLPIYITESPPKEIRSICSFYCDENDSAIGIQFFREQ